MSYLVIARKYRPRSFDEVVGQGHVTRTLRNAIKSGRIAHAYIFSGPRGVGKTTVARIMAKALNCKEGPTPDPCNKCAMCVGVDEGSITDVYEIDGASNTGVDDIRELRENVRYLPSAGRYNIYIIDEVHMLSINAFNALLKVLEEPPAHVIFIFATTEPHKIPVTILSRTQRFDFRRISSTEIETTLKEIAKAEGIEVTDDAFTVIAREAQGSMRDSQSLLDQVIGYAGEKVAEDDVREVLGLTDRGLIFKMAGRIIGGDPSGCLLLLNDVYQQGYDIVQYYRELLELMRNVLVTKVAPETRPKDLTSEEARDIVKLGDGLEIDQLTILFNILFNDEPRIKGSINPKVAMELTLIKMTRARDLMPIDELIERISNLTKDNTRSADGVEDTPFPSPQGQVNEPISTPYSTSKDSDIPGSGAQKPHEEAVIKSPPGLDIKEFLSHLEKKTPTMYSLLVNISSIDRKGNKITIGIPKIHLNLLDDEGRKGEIEKELRDYLNEEVIIEIREVTGENPIYPPEIRDPKMELIESDTAQNIIKVFDGATVEGYSPSKKQEKGG